MSARKKLNAVVICGSVLAAATIGLAFQLPAVFVMALAVLVATAVWCGGIRADRR